MYVGPGGVALWTMLPPQELMPWVRIPPGFKVFRENTTIVLYIIDLIFIVCKLKR
jgi:hypothetical protein